MLMMLCSSFSGSNTRGVTVGPMAWATGRVVPWRGFRVGAPGSWWGRTWGCATFMHAYFDGNSYINRRSGVVGSLWGCGSGFMLV
jgi:hypothetical protein